MRILPLLLCLLASITYDTSTDRTELTIYGLNEIVNNGDIQDNCAFSELKKVTIITGIIEIGPSAFENAKKLKEVYFHDNLLRILRSKCFYGCESLEEIIIPEGVHTLEKAVFSECTSLRIIQLPSSLTSVSTDDTFGNLISLEKFIMPTNGSIYSVSTDQKMLIKDNITAFSYVGTEPNVFIFKEIEIIGQQFLRYRSNALNITFEACSKLKLVSTSSFGVTSITSVTFPEGLQEIQGGFCYYTALKYIYIPSTLVKVGNIFTKDMTIEIAPNCSALYQDKRGIIFSGDNTSLLFIPSGISEIVIPTTVTKYDSEIIRKNRDITNLSVEYNHSTLQSFENGLYRNNYSEFLLIPGGIDTAYIHSNCTTLSQSSFSYTKVSRIIFCGNNITKILGSFGYTKYLTEIPFLPKLEYISSHSFQATSIQKIDFPSTFVTAEKGVFLRSKIQTANFSLCSSMFYFPEDFFYETPLTQIILPPNLQSIDKGCFRLCSSLVSISIPETVNEISSECFKDCKNLQSVIFEGNPKIKVLDSNLFNNTGLLSIDVPDSVEEIRQGCFRDCKFLKTVNFNEISNLTSIKAESFCGSDNITSIKFGKKLRYVQIEAFVGMYGLKSIDVFASNSFFRSIDGVLYEKEGEVLAAFPPGVQRHTLSNATAGIREYAFFKCRFLEDLSFGSSKVASLGEYTFLGCTKLREIEIPGFTSTLKANCFSGCIGLRSVSFGSESALKSLDSGAFNGCELLESVWFGANSSLEIIGSHVFSGCAKLSLINLKDLPKLREVCESAFSGCMNLKALHFPSSIESIGPNAFQGCIGLEGVSYCGEKFIPSGGFPGLSRVPALVSSRYPRDAQTFGGLDAVRVYDRDCFVGSSRFTASLDSGPMNVFSLPLTDDKAGGAEEG